VTREGTLIGDRYRLLGRAGHGTVHARDERLDRIVAVKPLFDEPPAAPTIPVPRAAASSAICDVVDEDSTTYLVLESPGARTLAELLEEHGTLAPGLVARFGAHLAAALAAAHDEGVLHAAVDPDHVVISAEGHAGIVAGSGARAYFAPEVLDGGFPDFPSDVFSLGATLYAALEGHPPYDNGLISPRTEGPVTDAVLRLLHPYPTARPTMAAAEELLSVLVSGTDGGTQRTTAGDYRCV
jgi:serine/threonine protein kinase